MRRYPCILVKRLKILALFISLCALFFYGCALPLLGQLSFCKPSPAPSFVPGCYLCGLPSCGTISFSFCFRALQKIAAGSGFSNKTAEYLKHMAMFTSFISHWFLAGNCLVLFLQMGHSAVFLLSLILIVLGGIFTLVYLVSIPFHIEKSNGKTPGLL